MKISKKRLANKVRKLEVQNYDMRQKIKKMDKALTYLDELTTELNHALPDPEYDAKCEENAIAVGESLDRHAVRLGLVKPQLKQLDQSDFKDIDIDWNFLAVDSDGALFAFARKPNLHGAFWGNNDSSRFKRMSAKGCYDATDWQNSLIERDKVELTGSDLCRAMLERGDKRVMCVSLSGYAMIITGFDGNKFVDSRGEKWINAAPINNQDEPLTASEVGL